MLAYEFFEQAFLLYEESVADSRMRVVALQVGCVGCEYVRLAGPGFALCRLQAN